MRGDPARAEPGRMFLGVMVDDAAKVRPDCIVTHVPEGFRMVDYECLEQPPGRHTERTITSAGFIAEIDALVARTDVPAARKVRAFKAQLAWWRTAAIEYPSVAEVVTALEAAIRRTENMDTETELPAKPGKVPSQQSAARRKSAERSEAVRMSDARLAEQLARYMQDEMRAIAAEVFAEQVRDWLSRVPPHGFGAHLLRAYFEPPVSNVVELRRPNGHDGPPEAA